MGERVGNLYVLKHFDDCISSFSCNSVKLNPIELWHSRLGHLSFSKLVKMSSVLPNLNEKSVDFHCSTCHLAKQKRLPFFPLIPI